MLIDIKQMLIENPEHIVELLERFEFCHIHLKRTEIRFARNEEGGQNISIRLEDNPSIYVKDFVTNENGDIIAYIMKSRSVKFIEVLSEIKSILGLGDDWEPPKRDVLFGGFYDRIGEDRQVEIATYPESIMDQYVDKGNRRWLDDNISLAVQHEFEVRFDPIEDLIVFPWRSPVGGEIIAVKARVNHPVEDGQQKYWYVYKGAVSNSLYGITENYSGLFGNEICVVESEKAVQQLATMGYRNAVALGSSNLSEEQARLIMTLSPTSVVFLLDEGLEKEYTMKNVETLRQYCVLRDLPIRWWNWTKSSVVDGSGKNSPTDLGKERFDKVMREELEGV